MSLILLVVGFALTAVLYLLSFAAPPAARRWLGLAAVACAAPLFFMLGEMSAHFDDGVCYTDALQSVAGAVARTDDPVALARRIEALPVVGYETYCPEVREAAAALPHASGH
ncbi:hypothetical protein [Stenotrophomonas sp.]|uniref:hypothetical protein n=1 Tax=Stenotrophomonas sp. TaxID=69392 RepID=UPI002FCB5C6A